MDFILWPRNDIEKIVCLLFSRWKGAEDEPYRPVQVRPIYPVSPRKRSRLRVKREMFLTCRPSLNFTMVTTRSSACTLWVGRTRLERWWTTQVSLCFSSWTDSTYRWASALKPHPWLRRPASLMVPSCCFSQTPKTKATVFKLCSLCLYLPQDQLTCWGVGGIEDHLRPYMPD